MKYYLVEKKYRYSGKFRKALEKGGLKYIKKLIKKGKLIILDNLQ